MFQTQKVYHNTFTKYEKSNREEKNNLVQSITAMQSNIIRYRDEIEIPCSRQEVAHLAHASAFEAISINRVLICESDLAATNTYVVMG